MHKKTERFNGVSASWRGRRNREEYLCEGSARAWGGRTLLSSGKGRVEPDYNTGPASGRDMHGCGTACNLVRVGFVVALVGVVRWFSNSAGAEWFPGFQGWLGRRARLGRPLAPGRAAVEPRWQAGASMRRFSPIRGSSQRSVGGDGAPRGGGGGGTRVRGAFTRCGDGDRGGWTWIVGRETAVMYSVRGWR